MSCYVAVDDVGHSVIQHKPLVKGEFFQASLAKVFDDPAMRPKVLIAPTTNRPNLALNTRDIEGAVSKPKDIAQVPRNTDPLNPRYILPSAAPPHQPQHAQAGVPEPAPSSSSSSSSVPAAVRNNLDVSDIRGASARPPPCTSQNFALDTSDIDGARPGWRPAHRAHAGFSVREQGLDVADINSYMPRPRPRPNSACAGLPPRQRQHHHPLQQRPRQQRGDWARQPPASASAALRSRPLPPYAEHFTTPEPPRQQRRPAPVGREGPPPGPAAEAGGEEAGVSDGRPVQLPGQREVGRAEARDVAANHATRVWAAHTKAYRSALAQGVIRDLAVSKDGVEGLWSACRELDREGCGKLTTDEFRVATQRAGLPLQGRQLETLMSGIADGAGLLPYRELSKTLLRKTYGVVPAAVQLPPRPPARPASATPFCGGVYGQGVGDRQRRVDEGISILAAARTGRPDGAPFLARQQHSERVSWAVAAQQEEQQQQRLLCEQQQQQQLKAGAQQAQAQAQQQQQQQQQQKAPSEQQHPPVPPLSLHQHHLGQPAQPPPPPQSPPQQQQQQQAALTPKQPQSPGAPQQPQAHRSDTQRAQAQDGTPDWPPATPSSPLQRRPKSAIEARSGHGVGGTHLPYKASPYWFGGNGATEDARAGWTPSKGCAQASSKIREPFLGDGGPLDPAFGGCTQASAHTPASRMPTGGGAARPASPERSAPRIPDSPTLSTALKSSALSREGLEGQLAGAEAQRQQHAQQQQQALREALTAARAGQLGSAGSTLQGLPGGVAATQIRTGGELSRPRPASAAAARPRSAAGRSSYVAGHAPAGGMFSSSLSRVSGSVRLERQMAREEIAAVRYLF
ncbi:MAG: hypothetical protein WDW36_004510 [Sanguina aurantia]